MNIPIPPLWQRHPDARGSRPPSQSNLSPASDSGNSTTEERPSSTNSVDTESSSSSANGRRRRRVEERTHSSTAKPKRTIMANHGNLLQLSAFGFVLGSFLFFSVLTVVCFRPAAWLLRVAFEPPFPLSYSLLCSHWENIQPRTVPSCREGKAVVLSSVISGTLTTPPLLKAEAAFHVVVDGVVAVSRALGSISTGVVGPTHSLAVAVAVG